MHHRIPGQSPGVPPVSVHFVNNVLAAAASYIEEDPDTARDVLAELGAFLSHRLRGPRAVSPAEELYSRPIMPYTEALLSAVPVPDPDLAAKRERIVLEGDVPSPINPPSGCRFHPRCRYATQVCSEIEPPLVEYGNGHLAACHHPLNVDAALAAVGSAPTAGDS